MNDNLLNNKGAPTSLPNGLPEPVSIQSEPEKKEQKKQIPQKKTKVTESNKASEAPKKELTLQDLVEKNIKLSETIIDQNKKIKRRITMMVVSDYLKLLIIIGPIIVALIYLPPLLKPLFDQYSAIIGGTNQNFDIQSIFSGSQVKPQDILSNISPENLQKLRDALQNTSPK